MSGNLNYVVKGAKPLFKLLTRILKKFNNLVVASSKPDLSQHKYSQFATLKVKDDGFEVISRKNGHRP